MKVLHVTPSFYPALVYGGPTHSVYQLCRSLVSKSCDVRVLTTNANGPDAVLDVDTSKELEMTQGLPVHYCRRVMGESVSPTLLRLLYSRIHWADVVHLMAVYSFPTIPTLLVSSLLGKPVVWSPRGMLHRWQGTTRPKLKTVWECVCRMVSPKQLVLHVTSDEEARDSEKRMPGIQVVVVPNSFDIPEKVEYVDKQGLFRLLYLGRLHPVKGIENLLAAYKTLNGNLGLSSSLTIAGGGDARYTEQIKSWIAEMPPSRNIRMTGEVTGEEKTKLFENADVVIVPSFTESFGMVVAEALAHGVPVIAARGTPWERLEELRAGLWVDNSPESLAEAIRRVSRMPLREMGGRGREWMKKEFSGELIAAKMMRVYENLITSKEKD